MFDGIRQIARRVLELSNAATPRPCTRDELAVTSVPFADYKVVAAAICILDGRYNSDIEPEDAPANAALIASYRQDAPDLADAVLRLLDEYGALLARQQRAAAVAGRWQRLARKWWGELDELRDEMAGVCSWLGAGQPTLVTSAADYSSRIHEGVETHLRVALASHDDALRELAAEKKRRISAEKVVATADRMLGAWARQSERDELRSEIQAHRDLYPASAAPEPQSP